MYSQHEEEDIITKFFGSAPGRFLDIGAFDGEVFSNTRKLFEMGWGGVCVEASPKCFVKLQNLYKDVSRIRLVCAAVHTQNGCFLFYDNGGAVATLQKKHMEQWKKPQVFKEIYVAAVTPAYLLYKLPGPYDFLSLDIEGISEVVLGSFPSFKESGLKLICVEAYTDIEKAVVARVMRDQGYVFHTATELNVFYKAS